ncbi:MAG: hypothetical protein AAF251_09080 [Pseudomonadota bacterium]
MRSQAILTVPCLALALSACGDSHLLEETAVVNEVDPYIARALNDPLMVDPDLAYRNEANAAITIGYDHGLPSFKGTEESASAAREVARLELLEEGPIRDLPMPSLDPGPASLANQYGVEAVLEVVDAPSRCRKDIQGDFAYAANLPGIARVMPHGMVRVAAAVEGSDCELRIVRYVTPVPIEDALQYHYTIATREGFEVSYFAEPETSLTADRRGTYLRVFARGASGNLTAVDVVTWSR